MKGFHLLSVVSLLASCAAGSDGARGKNLAPEVSHQPGRLRCPMTPESPKFRWQEDARASELRQIAVQALLRDTIEHEKGEFARPGRLCVLTNTTGWSVPAGVRVLPMPAIEDLKLIPGCRILEVDALGSSWAQCTFGGKPVESISMMARWWREPGEKVALGNGDISVYGVFADPGSGQVRIIRYELEP